MVGKSARQAEATAATRDGRVLRSERSREAIVNALLELIGDGVLEPTAQQVAERARVGIRTVFRHFSEMESIFAAVDARVEADARPLLTGGERKGSTLERARGLVRQRCLLFERIAPFKRSGNLKRWRSPFVGGRHRRMVRFLRADLLAWLPELAEAPADVGNALELLTSFEAWDRLRSEQRLGRERAAEAMERAVTAVIGSTRLARDSRGAAP